MYVQVMPILTRLLIIILTIIMNVKKIREKCQIFERSRLA